MKTQMGLWIEAGTADELRTRANRVGVAVGDLADLLVQFGLGKLTDAALAKWAASVRSRKGRLGGALRKSERASLDAMHRMKAAEGAWRFTLEDIARESGCRLRDAYMALVDLRNRGLVMGGGGSQEVDAWGRPLKSVWHLPEDHERATGAAGVLP